ncbi:branched-chain alpha-keto acid dehydrogenase E2 component [Dendryphion nanum]|uniref:Dihydrolipoamide acetyltransferase component of pyruvate dehydrogenase complex n=1 Tax=Dendryphion nanum TaxID=256645 RepID=A0A9P9E3S4_9PLEO|nr:branched-chain alpha-keto acid dehydrogenase E2 component [Dendryphion nanum]
MLGVRLLSLRRPLSRVALGDAIKINQFNAKKFHSASHLFVNKPYNLADIGEGITECQIIQWFVKPGDRVQEFDPICEVQSDKASVEITSRFDGRISKLLYDIDDMAKVGQPLVYIETDDIEDDWKEKTDLESTSHAKDKTTDTDPSQKFESRHGEIPSSDFPSQSAKSEPKSHPATPAVRHMLKMRGIDIADVNGTGKDGRVLKGDVQRYSETVSSALSSSLNQSVATVASDEDNIVPLTPVQNKMFQSMTASLKIPHLLFSHSVDLTNLNDLRRRLKDNAGRSSSTSSSEVSDFPKGLTNLPFIIKVLSHTFEQFPTMNAHLDIGPDSKRPQLIVKAKHDFGIAIDTPNGLLVPVIRNVNERSIISIATELQRLGALALKGRLEPSDFGGATFTISNLGSIGGGVLGPLIIPPMVGILGVGRTEPTPVFEAGTGGEGCVVRKDKATLSWAADHRVLDGAIVAKCATAVASRLKHIECLVAVMR